MRLRKSLSLVSFGLLVLWLARASEAAIPAAEREALVRLYNTANGPNWTNKTGWLGAAGTECQWSGVWCDDTRTAVTALTLGGNNLTGPVEVKNLTKLRELHLGYNPLRTSFPVLENLPSLQILYLMGCELTGSIPADIDKFPNLVTFSAWSNELTGPLPAAIGKLASLEQLLLEGNKLSGTLPPELGSLSKLQELYLGNNGFTGTLPKELGSLASLRILSLWSVPWGTETKLTEGIPVEFGNLKALERLILSGLGLSGAIPAALGNLTRLTDLALHGNEFETIENGAFAGMSNLESLELQYNRFSGMVPAAITQLPKLNYLDLSNNEFSGVPVTLLDLPNLEVLGLSGNKLTGELPADLGRLSKLRELWLSGNGLTGPIPASIGNLTNLERLHLQYNALSGEIPAGLTSLVKLRRLDLSENQLSGPLPHGLGRLNQLVEISLSSNKLSGDIPADIGNLANLESIDAHGNALTGPIPSSFGKLTKLQYLALYTNQLSGTFPPELCELGELRTLYLAENQIAGPLPGCFGDLGLLENADLSENQFRGTLPDSMGNLKELNRFSVSGNFLDGPLPASIGNLAKLTELNLATNRFSGALPQQFFNLKNLREFSLANNQFSGQLSPQIGSLAALTAADFNDNQFSGTLPPEIGNLAKAQYLTFSRNRLTGSIPKEIGKLSELRYLHLTGNQLSGVVPAEIKNLTNMTRWGLYLNYNALFTDDASVREFIQDHGGSFDDTQTLAPIEPNVGVVSTEAITLRWNPILYQNDPGGYEVLVGSSPAGPFVRGALVQSKAVSSATVTGLRPGTAYSFVVRTYTLPHAENPNAVLSTPSEPVTERTANPGSLVIQLTPASQRVVVGRPASVVASINVTRPIALTVTLSTPNASILTVPATVEIPAGQTSVTVPLTTRGPGSTYVRAELAGGTSAAADVIVSYDECDRPAAPSFANRDTGITVRAGSSFTLTWTDTLGQDRPELGATGGRYVVEVFKAADCSGTPRVFSTPTASATVSTRPEDSGTWCAAVHAVSRENCEGPDSDPLRITVRTAPAAFVVIKTEKTQEPYLIGSIPDAGKVTFKNIGNSAGTITFSSRLATFTADPPSRNVAANGTVDVSLVFDPLASPSPTVLFDSLCGTWNDGSKTRSACTPVTRTALGSAPVMNPAASVKLTAEVSNEVHFIAASGANPPTQSVTVRNNGTVATRLSPSIGPGGAWLKVESGDLVSPLAIGESRTFIISSDRSRRSVEELNPPVVTNIVFTAVDVASSPAPRTLFQIFDEEPGAVTVGARRNALAASEQSLIIPAGVSSSGIGTFYVSDGWVRNTSGAAVNADLYFTPDGADGLIHPQIRHSQITIQPYGTYRLADFVRGVFSASGSGSIELRSQAVGSLAVRTTVDSLRYTAGKGVSRFGAEIPTVRSRQGARLKSDGSPVNLVLTGLKGGSGSGFRSNVILSETSGRPLTFDIRLLSKDGAVLGESEQTIAAYSKLQINDGDARLYPSGVNYDGASLEIVPVEGIGSVVGFATVSDRISTGYTIRSGRLISPETPAAAKERDIRPNAVPARLVIPAVARLSGAANNSFFSTAVSVSNASAKTVSFSFRYVKDGSPIETFAPKEFKLEGRQSRTFTDVLKEALGIESTNETGMLFVEGPDLARIVVSSETSTPLDPNDPSKGSSPSTLAAYAPEASEAVGDPGTSLPSPLVSHPALEESDRYRTNLILAETAGESARVKVRLFPKNSDGTPLAEAEYDVTPFQRFQLNQFMSKIAGEGIEFIDVAVDVEWISGKGRVIAVATKVDNDLESKRMDVYVFGPVGTLQGSIGF